MFTYSGDIYSFGCLLWDLWHARNDSRNTTGEESVNEQVILSLSSQNLIKPVQMPQHYFNLVKQCLHQDKRQRPTMDEIIRYFSEDRPNSCGENTISPSEPYDVPKALNLSRDVTTAEHLVINRSQTNSELSDGSRKGQHAAVAVSSASSLPGVSENGTTSTSESGYTSAEPATGDVVSYTNPLTYVESNYDILRSDIYCYDVARSDVYGYDDIGRRHSVRENNITEQREGVYDRVDFSPDSEQTDTDKDDFSSDDEIYYTYASLLY